MSWRESFIFISKCKTAKWSKITDWLTSIKEKTILDGKAREEYQKIKEHDQYVLENIEVFQKHLCSYLVNYTKDKARTDVLSEKEVCAFESYRAILHKHLNISEERRLDVEARVLNPGAQKVKKTFQLRYRNGVKINHGLWKLDFAMSTNSFRKTEA